MAPKQLLSTKVLLITLTYIQISMSATIPVRTTAVQMQNVLILLAAMIASVIVATLEMASCVKVYIIYLRMCVHNDMQAQCTEELSYLQLIASMFTDVDECSNEVYPCDPNANCTNSIGNFSCTCLTGYSGNGMTCTGEMQLYSG